MCVRLSTRWKTGVKKLFDFCITFISPVDINYKWIVYVSLVSMKCRDWEQEGRNAVHRIFDEKMFCTRISSRRRQIDDRPMLDKRNSLVYSLLFTLFFIFFSARLRLLFVEEYYLPLQMKRWNVLRIYFSIYTYSMWSLGFVLCVCVNHRCWWEWIENVFLSVFDVVWA